jgi:D-arabinose 1-dehydrogenase-like Zn-dependent alcohol dehydrogenase
VIEAAHAYGRTMAGSMTAAGKLAPARVLVLGAGVAGLAAIQTAKNMGAVVLGYDVRPVVKEQVESMGGQFLKARSRRFEVLRRLHAVDATRLQESRSWVVCFSNLRPFGPSRATATPRAGAV